MRGSYSFSYQCPTLEYIHRLIHEGVFIMKKILCAVIVLLFASASYAATYSATSAGQHALSLTSGSATYNDVTVTKTGDATGSSDGTSGYDWTGSNAAVFASGGAKLTITGSSTINSQAVGGNAVFSYGGNLSGSNSGDGTTITISDATITTTKNNSGGIMVTGGGVIKATDLTVTTSGGSSAAIRSDKGGGTITVNGGSYTAKGQGSPAIYSTAKITGSDVTLESGIAQVVVIEGGNSVTLTDSTLEANHTSLNGNDSYYQAILIYQSQSGDASDGASAFTMTGGSITNAKGDIFHVTNTTTTITLNGVDITNNDSSGYLLRASSSKWGTSGSNGGKVTMKATNQALEGNILVDSASTLALTLAGSSEYEGAINTSGQTGTVSVSVASGAKWTLTADSYISSLTNKGTIDMGDYTLYVDGAEYDGTSTSVGGDTSYGTAPTITTKELKDATVGKSYSATLKATGTKTITWTTDTSALPDGMAFSSSGKLSGKPTEAGSYSLEFTATNNAGSDVVVLELDVNDQKPKIKGSMKAGAIDEEYLSEFTLSSGTGDIEWSIEGELPDGLEFTSDEDTAQISGTPTEAWNSKVIISAANETGGTDSKTFTLKVKAVKPKVGLKSLPSVMTGDELEASLDITGTKPITVTVTGLPDGITYNTDEGTLTGTPTVAGKYSIKVIAENSAGKAGKTLKLVVNSAPEIGDVSLEDGTTGKSYSYSFTATGTTPITWSVEDTDALPAGITLSSKGKLKGTPTGSGTYAFTVTAENEYGSDSKEATLTIKPVAPSITTKSLKKGTAGIAYNFELGVKGSQPITWDIQDELPDGINFEDGVFSGMCESAFSGSVTVTATNDGGTASRTYTLTISAVAPKITTKSLPSGRYGQDYSVTLSATGTPDIVWSWEKRSAPAGLDLDSETGKISGTPIAPGTYNVKVSAANDAKTVSKTFKIVIAAAASVSSRNTWAKPVQDEPKLEAVSGLTLPDGYEIVYELGEVSVDVSGMYDIKLTLDEADAGAKLFWLARPQNAEPSDDDTIAEFYGEGGEEIDSLPENKRVTVSVWLNAEVKYSPAIAVKK